MTTTDAEANVAPEVRLFLARVRRELDDLGPDVLSDITDGLEADFEELVEERGPDALGDPVEYARELRAAAGIPAGVKGRRGLAGRIDASLDAGHARFDRAVATLGDLVRTDLGPVVTWLRPLWWLLRAWAAVWVAGAVFGFTMSSGVAVLLLLIAVATSVFVGVGRVWPGGVRGSGARVVLLGVNVFAAFVLFMAWASGEIGGGEYDRGWNDGYAEAGNPGGYVPDEERAGLYSGGEPVGNIYPYDAAGKPLTGVQLFDQDGRPIDVAPQPDCTSTPADPLPPLDLEKYELADVPCSDDAGGALQPRIFYPWSNGAADLYNVFPLPSRIQPDTPLDPDAFADGGERAPSIQEPPLATVPKASLPGDDASSAAEEPSGSPSATSSAAPGAGEEP